MRKYMLAIALALSGCTKEKPFKAVPKPELGVKQEEKSVIDTTADYLYAPSTLESTRRSGASRPHWMGDAKRVRFVFAENALKVIEPEKDGRFADNPTNASAVLSIPIEHIDYKCAEDDFGDCTHREEKNEDITWDKKRFFMLKPEELALQQINFLPVEIANFFSMGACYKEVSSDFIKAEMTKDAVNLIMEKTYQGSPACANWADLEDVADLTFSVRYQYSFVKLNTVTTPDYVPAQYTRADENNFGYFNTQKDQLDIDNNNTAVSRSFLFDRWNPKRTVVYHMSEAFAKPEYASLKKATIESFRTINNSLEKAGAPLRLEIQDPVKGLSPGDLRVNSIVLVEDPQSIGVIGYGPHASNPLTGEIVQARVVMYLGTIKKYVKYSYDEMVDEKIAEQAQASAKVARLTLSPALQPKQKAKGDSNAQMTSASQRREAARLTDAKIDLDDIVLGGVSEAKLREFAVNPRAHNIFAKDLKAKIELISKQLGYPADEFNFADAFGGGIDEAIEKFGMRHWADLTEAEKNEVIAVVVPHVWVPTLVHELGHNLGLRHNFAGSEDKANFYSADELKALGVVHDAQYSSIMDYAYRTNNELRVMGKYDIAALKYGYAEKVELADGRVVSLKDLRADPSLEIKNYSYCTDEHVDANPNCNRFDEGTNLLEIAQHYVKAYEDRYKRSNFRNGRLRFSLIKDSAQIAAIDDTMFNLRLMFERYESIKNTFDLAEDAPEWESIGFLKELKAATLLAGQFYLNVLKTPDLLCAVSAKANPSQIIAVLPIRALSKRAISCFDPQEVRLNDKYMVVAEGGKSFQSRKDPNANHPTASFADEIDVRGIWMDKLLAAHYLFARQLGSTLFDANTENFLHISELQGPILETLQQLVTDEVSGPVTFRIVGGAGQADLNVSYQLFDVAEANNSHLLPALLDQRAAATLGLSDQNTMFHKEFLRAMMTLMPSTVHQGLSESLLGMFRVRDELPNDLRPDEYIQADVGGKRFFTLKSAPIASLLVEDFKAVSLLRGLTEEQIKKVIATEKADDLNETEKQAKALGNETLQKFIDGGYQSPAFYALMIESLAKLSP
jgi:hypothetical protein